MDGQGQQGSLRTDVGSGVCVLDRRICMSMSVCAEETSLVSFTGPKRRSKSWESRIYTVG